MTRKQAAENKKKLLDFHFGSYYRKWKTERDLNGELNDDRNIFLGMYDQLAEAIDAMGKVNNSFVWVAFREKMEKQEKEMCEIVKRFTGSYPIYGCGSIYYPHEI